MGFFVCFLFFSEGLHTISCFCYFSGNLYVSCTQNNIFIGYRILDWQLFSLSTLKIAFNYSFELHYFCWEVRCVLSLFLSIWRVLILWLLSAVLLQSAQVWYSLHLFFFFPLPCIYSAWGLFYFWNPCVDVFPQFWKILSQKFSQGTSWYCCTDVHFVWPSSLGGWRAWNWHLPLRKAHALANSLQSHT